jgi:hypothetical protein
MTAYAMARESHQRWFQTGLPSQQYYSVEFSIAGNECLYQFKIWHRDSGSMCLVVKEDSQILNSLKVGDVLSMRYYGTDSFVPPKDLQTQITSIKREDQGRFRGHFLVGLAEARF